jgi:hypothetical protein
MPDADYQKTIGLTKVNKPPEWTPKRLPSGKFGVELPFTPKRAGVYLLRVTWELTDGGTLTGPPVVLTVFPKHAAK